MKKIFYSFAIAMSIVSLTSCSSDPRKEMVSEYEQTIFDTKIDLSLSVKEIVDGNPITAKDSLNYYKGKLVKLWGSEINIENKIEELNGIVAQCQDVIDQWSNLKSSGGSMYYTASSKVMEYEMKKVELESNLNVLSILNDVITKYESMGEDKVLHNTFTATYTIKNPLLNGATQELTHTYYTNSENTKIVGTL